MQLNTVRMCLSLYVALKMAPLRGESRFIVFYATFVCCVGFNI
jgi:hypothetical protein